jgi:hypothetical protein
MFRRNISPLALFATCFTLVDCSAYSSTLKVQALCSSETLVYFPWTARQYIPEDRTLQTYRISLPVLNVNIKIKNENIFNNIELNVVFFLKRYT